MKTVVLDYGAGNIASLSNALLGLGAEVVLTADLEEVCAAERVIFPGVGAAGSAMQSLQRSGLARVIPELRQPVLGICLGMQLLCKQTEEDSTPGLGIFDMEVTRFRSTLKVPHMGWNSLDAMSGPLFQAVAPESDVYFVHSYCVGLSPETIAETSYPSPFSASIAKENFYGVQFHPEKSSAVGALILENFLNINS